MNIRLSPSADVPTVQVVSNNTWCSTRRKQVISTGIVGDAVTLDTGSGLHRVGDGPEAALMILAPQVLKKSVFFMALKDGEQ
jgi:hypothetical protein